MNESITTIPYSNLLLVFIPVAVIISLLHAWSLEWKNTIYAVFRMLVQLLLIGYFLAYIFESNDAAITVGVLLLMVFAGSWIALRTIQQKRSKFYQFALMTILTGGDLTLLLVTQFVLKLNPWFITRYMIPLAGMIFASSIPMASSHIFPISMSTHRNKKLNLQSVNHYEEYVISYKKEIKKTLYNKFIHRKCGWCGCSNVCYAC